MFQDIMDELQFFPLIFNFDICGFDIYGTLVARINRVCRGLPVIAIGYVNYIHRVTFGVSQMVLNERFSDRNIT
jgi:hypothetical protein